MSLTVRPGILEIAAYVPGEHALPGEGPVYKMSSNESALGASPAAIQAYQAAARELHRYPDGASLALRVALAASIGADPEEIVCGAGSDDILTLLARAYAGQHAERPASWLECGPFGPPAAGRVGQGSRDRRRPRPDSEATG